MAKKKLAELLLETSSNNNNLSNKKDKQIVIKLTTEQYTSICNFSDKLSMSKQDIVLLSLRETGFIS